MVKHTFSTPKLLHLEVLKGINLTDHPGVIVTYDIECSDPVRIGEVGLKLDMVFLWRWFMTSTNQKLRGISIYEHRAAVNRIPGLNDLQDFERMIILSLQAVVFEHNMIPIYGDQEEVFMEDPPTDLPYKLPALVLPKVIHDVVAGKYD